MPKGTPGKIIIICPSCNARKEHYAKGQCRPCYWRQYYQERRMEIIQSQKEWRAKNRERHREYNHRWRQEHSEEKKLYSRRYYQEHQEDDLARSRRWQQDNPEKVAARNRRWQKKNPEKMRIYVTHRRARKMKAKGHASAEQILARIEYYGGLCYLCGKPYEAIDHVIPLSRGGSNWPANQRPICGSCNSRKGAKLLQEFRL